MKTYGKFAALVVVIIGVLVWLAMGGISALGTKGTNPVRSRVSQPLAPLGPTLPLGPARGPSIPTGMGEGFPSIPGLHVPAGMQVPSAMP